MPGRKYPINRQECIVCKVKFDNWITTNGYGPEQEEAVRRSFCNYCPYCEACGLTQDKTLKQTMKFKELIQYVDHYR